MYLGIGNNFDDLYTRRINGTDAVNGNNGTKEATSTDLATELAGNNEEVAIEDIEKEYADAEAAVKGEDVEDVENAKDVEGAQATDETTAVGTGEESQKIKEEIEELQKDKEENEEKMEKIEAHIEDLAESAEQHILEAAAAQESAVAEHEDEAKAVLSENINAYIAANKEGGEGMTKDELQKNIKGAMPNTPQVADAVAALTAASEEVSEIDACLGDLNKLINDTQAIDEQIELKQGEYEAAVKAEEEAAKNKSCDPIGFTTTDAEGNEAQYDFIVDDGAFDSTNDFLGANGQWGDMQALDTDGDQIVSLAEMQAANIKAVKTNADGSQEVVDLSEEFGEDFSVDLASYEEGGSHSAVDTTTDSDGDGTADQEMLGTFNVNANGQSIQGYNTLDDVDWLADNYGITAETATEDSELDASAFSESLQAHVNFFNLYTEKSADLKEQIEEAYKNLELTDEEIAGINDTTKKAGVEKANEFLATLDTTEETEEAEETEEGTEAEATEETTEENAENGLIAQEEKKDETTTEAVDSKLLEDELLELEPPVAA